MFDYDVLNLYGGGIPDPFLKPDGTRVLTVSEFKQHREYLKALLSHFVYGKMPEMPNSIEVTSARSELILNGAAVQKYETLSFENLNMDIRITYPANARGLPVIMKLDYLCDAKYRPMVEDELLLERKYAFVTISRKDLCDDVLSPSTVMPFPENDLGAIALWAWGARVCLDYIWDMDFIDNSRVALTGHSRDGKAAICAAAMDTRFAAVIPNGSGCGGAGSFIVKGRGSETPEIILKTFPHWFCNRLRKCIDMGIIPADMIFARALIAPRPVLCTEAALDLWANPYGTYVNTVAAREICEFLGADNAINGMVIRKGEHNQTDEDWRALISFCNSVFYRLTPEIDFNKKHFEVDENAILWSTPNI